ncbi:MAG: hypothetical protein H8E38_11290 [SAR324 cluster bacterium]|nr:hypothetical protein [SAR324 cluster bacterium]MBL7034410.1 hypothetical protein [SAR324 cluster bacterium]
MRLRAREHFDTVKLNYENQFEKETTSGIGPTINFWWEEPYQFSFGLALGLMYIDFNRQSKSIGRGQRMELWKLGFEGKHDPFQGDGGIFIRWGVSKNLLKSEGTLGELKGNGAYLGIGWEFPFEILGLALEIAQRQIRLENNLSIVTTSPSIGVHFYRHL